MIERILSHLRMDPQPPPEGCAHEAGRDFAACAVPAVGSTSPRAAPPNRSRDDVARPTGSAPSDSGSSLTSRPNAPLVNGQGPAEPGSRDGADARSNLFELQALQAAAGRSPAVARALPRPVSHSYDLPDLRRPVRVAGSSPTLSFVNGGRSAASNFALPDLGASCR